MLWTYNQHNFAGGRLDKELMGRQDLTQYFKGASEIRNFVVRRQGMLSKRRGTDMLEDVSSIVGGGRCRLIPLVFSKEEGYYLLMTSADGGTIQLCDKNGMVNADGGGRIVNSGISAGTNENLFDEIDFFQSGDLMYIVHKSFAPKKLSFFPNTKTITIETLKFNDVTVSKPTSISVSQQGFGTVKAEDATQDVTYAATFVDTDGIESLPLNSSKQSFKIPWPNTAKMTISVVVKSTSNLDHINIYKKNYTSFGLIGKISKSEMSSTTGTFNDDFITPDLSVTPPKTDPHFKKAADYPSTVALYQQRLVFASSSAEPFKFWMSCVGDLYNFSTHDSIREDDSISAALASTEMPEINHAVMTKNLMLFTESGEWEVSPITGNTLSYKTVSAKMQSTIGSSKRTKPIVIGDEIVFVDASCRNLYATRYNFASDGYESQDLTIMSQWLFRNRNIRRIAYKRYPDSEIICVMDDGTVSALAYMKEHEVCAWSRHVLGGGYEVVDVACSKAMSKGSSDVLLVVKKAGRHELWRVRDDIQYGDQSPVSEHVCLDGVRMIGAGTTVPVGHVAIGRRTLATFTAGQVVTEDAVSGYPFEATVMTVYPDAKGGGDNSLQMEIVNPTESRIRTIDSAGFTVRAYGSNVDSRVQNEPTVEGGLLRLNDRDARVILAGINARDGRIVVTDNGPFPINILSIGTTYQVELENGGGNG
ncbi:MAG: hypothetical protein MJZ81_07620 [Bacteroidales bacterium]|nr:hypothetical protein [Bacteroidales bacterium]